MTRPPHNVTGASLGGADDGTSSADTFTLVGQAYTELGVNVGNQTGAVEAGGARATPHVGHTYVLHGQGGHRGSAGAGGRSRGFSLGGSRARGLALRFILSGSGGLFSLSLVLGGVSCRGGSGSGGRLCLLLNTYTGLGRRVSAPLNVTRDIESGVSSYGFACIKSHGGNRGALKSTRTVCGLGAGAGCGRTGSNHSKSETRGCSDG